jgi:methylenetetrahydrofolate reductase (NADPH)
VNAMKSNLQRVLESGAFAVTAECGPPRSADADVVIRKGLILKKFVDAVNVTDNQTAIVRMSSIAASAILTSIGVEPVAQMVCRDRNRIAIQSDVLGASALGVRNLLCLSGDHQKFGNQAQGKNVYDIDSMQLLRAVTDMTDKGRFIGDDAVMDAPPCIYPGAAENPFADPFEYRVLRLEKKIEAGAKFIQTQCVFNLEKFGKFMALVRKKGLHKKVHILAGVTPIKSAGMARYMRDKVAGMDVPEELIARVAKLKGEEARAEGVRICVETIQKLRKMEGVAGVHIMAIEWEEAVPEIVEKAGLLPRP